MSATSMGRMVVLSLALVAAGGTALVFGITHEGREPPVSTGGATVALTAPPAVSGIREERSVALATPQAETSAAEVSALAGKLAVSPGAGRAEDSLPAFDIARVEQTGEAVIAGRAAPGAVVELLRGGERLDQVVADASGQFVMVPPRLPAGAYELTLRSRMPDGRMATSSQGVAVALNEADPAPRTARSHVEASADVSDRTAAIGASQDQAATSSPRQQTPLHVAKGQDVAISLGPRRTTTVVSRGDSLWRISRNTYGVGTQYSLVYKANREHIRDPDRIYPGQIFVLPMKAR